MSQTSIEWATHVWNPVTGCDRVSPGCAHCYALTYAARLKAMGQPKYQRDGGRASGPGFGVTMHRAELEQPFRWKAPRPRVFVNSMSDLFHEDVTDGFIANVWWSMAHAPEGTNFLILTKRPERMRDFVTRWADVADAAEGEHGMPPMARGPEAIRKIHTSGRALLFADMLEEWGEPPTSAAYPTYDWMQGPRWWPEVAPNVWLGVSIENHRFIHRADQLRETPAAVRFISAEPLLGPLMAYEPHQPGEAPAWDWERSLNLDGVDWLIVGGESGPDHRRIDEAWVGELRDAAAAAGTAFFFKQWGGRTPKAGGRQLAGREWSEFPSHDLALAAAGQG